MASKKSGKKKINRSMVRRKGKPSKDSRPSISSLTGFRILDSSYYGVMIIDLSTVEILYTNSKLRRILGYTKSEIERLGLENIVSPQDWGRLRRAARSRLLGKPVKTGNRYNAIHKNGREVIFDVYTNPIIMGGRKCLAVILKDVSKEISLENELKESEQKYRAVVDNIADGIAIVMRNRFVYCNPAFGNIFGYRSNLLEGKRGGVIMPAGSKMVLAELEKSVWKSGHHAKTVEAIGLKKDGSELHLKLRASRISYQNRNALQVTITDITAEKNAREELRASEERFRMLVEGTQYGFFIVNLHDLEILYLNDYARNLVGSAVDSMNVRQAFEMMSQSSKNKVMNMFRDLKAGKRTSSAGTISLQMHGDKIVWLEYQAVYAVFQGKKCCQGMFKDITQLIEANQSLSESTERFRQMAENIREFFWIIDRNTGRTLYVSPIYEEMVGLPVKGLYRNHNDYLKAVHPDDKERMASRLDELEKETDDEYRIIHDKTGELRWLRSRTYPIRNSSGKVYRTTGIVADITDRKMWEEKLKESEARYRALVEDQTEFISRSNPDTIVTFVNEAACRYFDTPKEYFIGKSFLKFLPKDDKRKVSEQIKSLSPANPVLTIEHKVKLKDGNMRWNRWINRMLYDENGKPREMLGVGRDITEQRLAEEALRESELKFRAIFENTIDGIAVYERYFGSPRQKLIDCNESYAAMAGRPKNELLAFKNIRKIRIAYGKGHDEAKIQDLIENGKPFTGTYSWVRPDGRENYIEFEAAPVLLGERIILYTVDRDITERKRAEEELRESEEKYRSVVDNIGIGISLISPNMRIISFNRQMERWFPKIAVEEVPVCYKAYNDPPKSRICSYCPTAKTLKDGRVHESVSETPRNGRIVNYKIISSPIKDKDGNIMAAIEVVEDVTERRRAEEEIRKFKTISDRASYGTVITDMDRKIIYCNECYAQMHDMTIDEVLGKDIFTLFPPQQHKPLAKSMGELGKLGRISASEFWHCRKDGTLFPTLTNAQIITDDEQNPLYVSATAIDITDKKKAEVALKNQRDMLRDVTGHVIKIQEEERRRISMELHDSIGQSLSVTKLQVQNLLKQIKDENHSEISKGLDAISNLVSDTIKDLRLISANLRPVILDNLGLWPTIEWYLKDFGKKADLQIQIEIEDDLPGIVQKAEVHVFRVIQEIMINIQKHSKAKHVVFKCHHEKSRINIEIQEDGSGFDPDAIFDPSARRLGMGLINIMERVKIVKGKLDIKSEAQGGAKFIVSIPISGSSSK